MKSPKKKTKTSKTRVASKKTSRTARAERPLGSSNPLGLYAGTPDNAQVVSHIPLPVRGPGAIVGRTKNHITSTGMRSRFKGESIRDQVTSHMKVAAACGAGMGTGAGLGGAGGLGGGFSGGGGLTGGGFGQGTIGSSSQNFYSPELSTDFLQLPQSLVEFWNYYRFFYENDPFVGRAVDLHTSIPLSKTRINFPDTYKNKDLARKAQRFCKKWSKRVNLDERLTEILHNYNLFGEANIWCDDSIGQIPEEVQYKRSLTLLDNGVFEEELEKLDDANDRLVKWMKKNYSGWKKIRILAPEHVHVESIAGASQELVLLQPDAKLRHLIDMAGGGDEHAARLVQSMDSDLVQRVESNEPIFLNTDPYLGSFYTAMRNTRDGVETRGHSILQRCLLPGTQILVFRPEVGSIEVPVEHVRETDMAVSHKLNYRKMTSGSRYVLEEVCSIYVEGCEEPLSLTKDHEVLVGDKWIEAGKLKKGDLLRKFHLKEGFHDPKFEDIPITKIVCFTYDGPVFSFQVEEDESHITNGIVTHNCLRVLVHNDLLRQAQNQIASRHMTPVRLIYAEGMDIADTEELRDQIDMALQDPDYSVITNFQVTWEELNSNGRLLDLGGEYDLMTRQLYAGLGVTESLLSGESSYSGDRINLEVINIMYLHVRIRLKRLVEEEFFKPMCAKMGFVEEDEDGDLITICPGLSFTRIALRDNADTFSTLFDLYQKGSLDIETIYDTLNIDYEEVQERIQRDFMTFSDPNMNEVSRGMYSRVGDSLAENSNLAPILANKFGLKYSPKEEDSRF